MKSLKEVVLEILPNHRWALLYGYAVRLEENQNMCPLAVLFSLPSSSVLGTSSIPGILDSARAAGFDENEVYSVIHAADDKLGRYSPELREQMLQAAGLK